MLLSLALAGLVIGIIISQSTYGAFSSLLMAVLTVCCAGLAFGVHEWLAVSLLAKYWKADLALAIALGASFAIPLVILRISLDKGIARSCPLPTWLDRAAGAVCGTVTALVIVGMLAICLQLLPFGDSILGWSRFDLALRQGPDAPKYEPAVGERSLALGMNPDRFAAGLACALSNGVFSGAQSFHADHPDYVQMIGWTTTTRPELSRFASPGSLSVVSTSVVPSVFRLIPGDERRTMPEQVEEIPVEGDKEFRVIRVKLGAGAKDVRKSLSFTLRQFQLVGRLAGALRQYHAVAIQQLDATQPVNRHIRFRKDGRNELPVIDNVYAPRDGDEVEVVFELPKNFTPEYLTYKMLARAKVQFGKDDAAGAAQPAAPPATPAAVPTSPPAGSTPPASGGRTRRGSGETVPSTGGQGGRVRGLTTLAGGSFFGNQFPVAMKAYQTRGNTETGTGVLKGGHLIGQLDQQEAGKDQPVERFDVPSDKRLLQLQVGKLKAGSTLGRALGQAISVAQRFVVKDSQGREYPMVGKYAVAKVGDHDVIELEYFPEHVGMTGALGPFQRIKESDLKPDDPMVLLFLVEPGATMVEFSTGGDASRADDLRGENLTAPK